MVDEIEVEPYIKFNRLLSQQLEGNRETSFNEAENIVASSTSTMLRVTCPNPKTCSKVTMTPPSFD